MSDLISRQTAIEAFKPYALYDSNRTNAEWVTRIEAVLEQLPSAEKRGKWIKNVCRCGWHCSACGEDDLYAFAWNCDKGKHEQQDLYCPNCGAQMKRSEG